MDGAFTSGMNGRRGGKPAIESMPEARLTFREMYTIKKTVGPQMVFEGNEIVVKFGLNEWPVAIATSPCRFGGGRRWLVCGACQSKRVALYVAGTQLACRVCLKLRYRSNSETERDRAFRRVDALRQKLNWRPGVAHPNGSKPKGMHRKTFARLVAEHNALANYLLGNVSDWIDRAETRLRKKDNDKSQ